ncbi:LOW QUALITY PROTEIN: limbic system-associated membrane protein [Aphomia sociella]
MSWAVVAVLACGLICSVCSTEPEDTEPRLQVMARSTVFNAGETKAIFCKAMNIDGPIEWRNPSGGLVKERSVKNSRVYVEKKESSGILIPLIIHDIKISDSGSWTCKGGDLNETIEILVGVKVNITDRNVTIEGDEGKSAKLNCEAEGHPAPVVQWYRDSKPIEGYPSKYVMRKVKDHNYQLEIKNLGHMDVGEYVCKVTQKALSHYTDKTVFLSVNHKPILYNAETRSIYSLYKSEEVYAILNETKNIMCSAFANPPPIYKWYKRNNNFDEAITANDTVITSADGSSSILILRMRNLENTGEYICTAINNRGKESIVFHVTLGAKPEQPDFVMATEANATHITFNVTCSKCVMVQDESVAPDPKKLTLLGFQFQLVPFVKGVPPDWDSATDFDVDILSYEDTSFDVGPLPNATTFNARVRSRNAAGYSEWTVISPDPKTTDNAIRLVGTTILIMIALLVTRLY